MVQHLKESDIVDSVKCPIFDKQLSALELCANKIYKAAIAAKFNGVTIKLADLRELFVKQWDLIWLTNHDSIPPTGPYWEGPKVARVVAHKIYSLLLYNEVLHPVQPYELVVDTYTIKGEYALIREKANTDSVSIVVIHTVPFFRTGPPEPTALLRYWHLATTSIYKKISVLHIPILRGRNSYQEFKDLSLTETYVKGLVLSYAWGNLFPRPGYYCDTCKSKKCMEIYNVRSYGNPWQRQLTQIRS